MARVLDELRGRFAELESDGAEQVLQLALAIARQVVRREVEVDASTVMPALREAVASVIDQQTHPRVHLNPADLEHLRVDLEADGLLKGCRFVPDASVQRGGCRVETAHSDVDATIESRWQRVLAAVGIDPRRAPRDIDA
jgi:flagellar assembly protein FliH